MYAMSVNEIQGSHTFSKIVLILFQYLFNTKLKKFNNITSLHFPNFLIMKLNFAHPITLHKYWSALPSIKTAQMLLISFSFRISILFQYLMYILAKFNTFSRSWKTILKFNTFSLLSILRGNPGNYWTGSFSIGVSISSSFTGVMN